MSKNNVSESFEEWVGTHEEAFGLPWWWDTEGGAAHTMWNDLDKKIRLLRKELLKRCSFKEFEEVEEEILKELND